jgi:phosphohistidine phosphatase
MRVYLVQLGKALSMEENPDRSLTDEGRRDVEKVAAFVKPLNLQVDAIVHSGKTRAAQTAELLASAVTTERGVAARDGLAPNDSVEPLRQELQTAVKDIMIVGHMPFLRILASALVVGQEPPSVVGFRQGGVVCLERTDEGTWHVAWVVTPELLQ